MTIEQIEQAAEKFCNTHEYYEGSTADDNAQYEAFVEGALSRQPEIDQLIADVERYKNDVAVYSHSIRRAQEIIKDERAENKKLTGVLDAMLSAAAEEISWENAIQKAQELIKKHE